MYLDDYKRWLETDLDDAALKAELESIIVLLMLFSYNQMSRFLISYPATSVSLINISSRDRGMISL